MEVNFFYSNIISKRRDLNINSDDIILKSSDNISLDNSSCNVLLLSYNNENLDSIIEYKLHTKFDAIGFISDSINANDVSSLKKTIEEIKNSPGILQKEQITTLLSFHILIYNSPGGSTIPPAKYELSLSAEHYTPQNGFIQNNEGVAIDIAPLSYAIVMAKEICNFPKFICGAFDLKVSLFCKGIILSNGMQIDPGYRGVLLSLLFNTNAQAVQFNKGIEYASLMFFTISGQGTEGYSGTYMNSSSLNDVFPRNVYDGGFSFKAFTESVNKIETNSQQLDKLSTKQTEHDAKLIKAETNLENINSNIKSKLTLTLAGIATVIALAAGSPIVYEYNRIYKTKNDIEIIGKKIDAKLASLNRTSQGLQIKIKKAQKLILQMRKEQSEISRLKKR